MLAVAMVAAAAAQVVCVPSLPAQQPVPPSSTERDSPVYSGLAGRVAVGAPRIDADVVMDGALSEPVWQRAARLGGFSQFQPVDGRPANDSTEVLVWYSSHAVYFGVRAFEAHGAVHATLADRDKIGTDDYVQILLDTFNDRRRAMVFGVNPLGVQSDGILTEGLPTRSGPGGILGPGSASVRDTADLSADYTFQSKGRLTDYGYEVEVRIPFKSIRYQSEPEQTWGLNVVRRVQHSGYEDTWTPTRRASASFLGQSGTLVALNGLRRGLVLDLNPVVTSRVTGAPVASGWSYDASRPAPGANVRWGITNNLTLNGTVKPDFSQVEADVQQVIVEPRAALFYPEKRPFFLEGIEQFETPNQLIYTRRVAQPVAAAKLTGKAGNTTIGLLSAVDDQMQSTTGTNQPIYNMLRLRQDLGRQSVFGVVYTDKIDGDDFNRMAGLDARIVFDRVNALSLQGAGSLTRRAGVTARAPTFQALFERAGRGLTLRYDFQGFHPEFEAGSGFIRRGGLVQANFNHRFTFYGKPGAGIENVTLNVPFHVDWKYRNFFGGGPAGDIKNDNSVSVTLRGGWRLGAIFFPESFKYDPDLYADYAIERLTGTTVDTIPFTGTDRLQNWDLGINVQTPQYDKFNAFLSVLTGQDENFFEWSSAWIWYVTATADVRPSDRMRINARYQRQQFVRLSDWTTVGNRNIPRVKIEYQLARAIFLRLVAQYDIQWRDSLRDDSRTNFPLLIRNGSTGIYERATSTKSNDLRVDWLFSYQPNPGTVFFAGYGSSLTEPDPFAFRGLRRTSDGFFVKLSYLLRI